nr:hypothetical protein [Acidovorax sp. 100]
MLITNMKGSLPFCAMISMSNACGSATLSRLTHPSFSWMNESVCFFTRRPGNCCGDRGGALRQWRVLVEHPDAKARLAAVFRKQSFQAEVAFLEEAATVRPLDSLFS